MPIDLPMRKKILPRSAYDIFDQWLPGLAVVCLTVALAGLMSFAPHSYRDTLSMSIAESSLLGP